MLETYKVGVVLELGGNVQTGIDRLIAQMDTLQNTVNDTSAGFRRLLDSIAGIGRAGRSITALSRALEKVSTGAGVSGFEKMAAAAKSMTGASERLTSVLRENAQLAADMAKASETAARTMNTVRPAAGGGGAGAGAGRGRHSGFSGHDLMHVGLGAQMIADPLLRGGENAFERAIDMGHLRTQILADKRVSPGQADEAVSAAYSASTTAPGTSPIANLGSLIDLKNLTGSLSEAQAVLPDFAKLASLLSVMDRKKGGSGDPVFAAGKALDIMGAMIEEHQDASGHTVRELDPDLLRKRLDMMARVSVATGGRIGPQDYLAFAKQARVAGMNLSDEFTYERLPAIMLGMGGSRAGTALMSMAQVFEGGKLEPKSMAALIDIGLAGAGGLTKEGGHKNRRGEMVGGHMVVHPEAIYDLQMMRTDPDKWAAKAGERMDAAGIHGTAEQIVALMSAAQRSTIAGALADFLKDKPLIDREQQNVVNTRADAASYFAQQDPAAKLMQLQTAWDRLLTSFGSSAMDDAVKVMNATTTGLNNLSAWAEKNPGMARLLTDTGVALGGIASALGTLSVSLFLFGPALKLLRGGAGAAAGGGAAAGAGAAAGSTGFLGWLAGAALRVAPFGAALGAYWPTTANPGEDELVRRRKAEGWSGAEGSKLPDMHVELRGPVVMDGRKVGDIVANGLAKTMGGPSKGMTGFDFRASPPSAGGGN